ncbi:MAG: sigma-54-dependent Fis family transcriptional regulator, partial [Leptospiraceae bacterium]|nr:sigma-54-dependent Fis family transcriptional regulator [Leptospiraceae bacterium]
SVLERVIQVAPTDVTVLLEGESGTGKEKIANLIHDNSSRKNRPFVKVNCGALTKSILESELFGAVKGAFTGADRDRAGLFESANGGTIFLDEIGEMDLESQVRLLRVIEEREVMRVGSTQAIKIDVRIIAATNRDLLDRVDTGEFREDLYYRLAVIRLELPPLRDRRDDIPLLFNYFVTEFNEKYGKSVTSLSRDLLQF